jgi:hypothetical protein
MRRLFLVQIMLACLLVSGFARADDALPAQSWFPKAPPLPRPAGEVLRVTTVDQLFQAARDARPGGTIVVAPGHYYVPTVLELRTDDVTLRGESGDRNAVILDGERSRHGELLTITGCSGVTIADLTIQNVRWNGFKLNYDRGTRRVTLYNCVARNIWQRMVKAPRGAEHEREGTLSPDCRIQYCLFHNDRPKRFADDSDDKPDNFGGNYVGGIDAMRARGWVISDNVFSGIRGRTREGRGAVFLWVDSSDCIVERNIVIDCDAGICLGNSYRGDHPVSCTNCIVRNNFVTGGPEAGIFAGFTKNCKILHNSIHDPASRFKRLVRIFGETEGLVLANNLLSGPNPQIETNDKIEIHGNYVRDVTDQFVDPAAGNLHLKGAIDGVSGAVARLPEVLEDIDRKKRSDKTDIGAHELSNPRRP